MKFQTKIELCEIPEEQVAARAKIKMTALKIAKDESYNNENGINWNRQYVENNMKSLIGGAYKVAFIDDEKTYPSGHGNMQYDEDGNAIFPDSDTVGSIQDVYVEDIEMDSAIVSVLVTEGYLYKQSYPNFYNWLKDETNQGTVYGSVEINGKGDSNKIIYANDYINPDGSLKIGRMPQIYDFTSVAILSSFVPPADKYSRVIEVNQKGEKIEIKIDNSKKSSIDQQSWNINAGNFFRKCKEALNAKSVFNEAYLITNIPKNIEDITESDVKYPHHYFKENTMVVSVDGIHAAASRLAANDSNNTEAKNHLRKHFRELGIPLPDFLDDKINKEVNSKMEENKVILELNQKIEDKTTEISKLSETNKDLQGKNTELSEAVVNANKSLEETNAKINSLTEELNACRKELEEFQKEKEQMEKNQKIADTEKYFKTEISRDGFIEEEINSLKSFLDSGDLDGLKAAESELCTKKFKEKRKTEKETNEINSKEEELFFSTKAEINNSTEITGSELFQ